MTGTPDSKTTPRPYSKHGLNPIRRRVTVEGLEAIDQRTGAARALLEWRRDLVADLGGEGAVTTQQRALVEVAARTKLYVDHLDAFLMQQRSLVNKTRKTALPVLLQRQALADSLVKHLNMLGLERRSKPVPSLDEYLASSYAPTAAGDASEAPEAQPEAPEGSTAEGERTE
jgi:hypothetical protein